MLANIVLAYLAAVPSVRSTWIHSASFLAPSSAADKAPASGPASAPASAPTPTSGASPTGRRPGTPPKADDCIADARFAVSAGGPIEKATGAAAFSALRDCVRSLLEAGRGQEALAAAKAGNAVFPAEPQSGYDYGAVLLLTQGDPNLARSVIEESLKRPGRFTDPSTAERALALNNLGKIALERGETAHARELFHETLKLDDTLAGVYFNLAIADRKADDAAACVKDSEQAFGRSPDTASREDYLVASWAYHKQGRAAEGAALLRRGISALPNGSGLHLGLGEALAQQGRPVEALLEYYYEFMNDSASDPHAVEARRRFTDGIAHPEGVPQFSEPIAWLRTAAGGESGDHEKAFEALARLERAGYHHPTLYHLRAKALSAAGRKREAEVVLRKSLLLDPAFLPPYYDLSTLLREAGKPDEARTLVGEAVIRNPSHWQLVGERAGASPR